MKQNDAAEIISEVGDGEITNANAKTSIADEVPVVCGEDFKTFKTKEEYQSEIDRILGSRFKSEREIKEKLASAERFKEEVLSKLNANDEADAMDKLMTIPDESNIVLHDEELTAGTILSFAESYSEELAIEKDELLENSELKYAVSAGIPPDKAYKMVFFDEIVSNIVKKTEKKLVDSIIARGFKMPENGLAKKSNNSTPYKNLTSDDIDNIRLRVRKGEKIRL